MALPVGVSPAYSYRRLIILLFCGLLCAYLGACCTMLFSSSLSSPFAADAPLPRGVRTKPLDEAAEKALVRAELGRSSWNLLHRLAASFDKAPSLERRREAEQFFGLLGVLYPCPDCAAHFRELLKDNPVDATNNRRLSLWLCGVHNLVNARLGKAEFPCTLQALAEKWGSCGCFGNISAPYAPEEKE
jgi:FAD-linked sulfhydryl oxidase